MKTPFFLLSTFLFMLSSCYYDVEKELYPPSLCDTTNLTFSSAIVPIIQKNCVSCHNTLSPGGNIILDTYGGVSAAASSGKLYGSITYSAGYSPMPPGGTKLSNCDLTKINKWINNGILNN
ncbi:MAG TPA: cytochrome c [Chitinophagaceae bacterium]|nr:cytochrome c [Chitinophagaceae bacterium]